MKLIKFIRGAVGPYSKSKKIVTDEDLALRGIALFGETPPARGEFWKAHANDRSGEIESFLKDLLEVGDTTQEHVNFNVFVK